MPTWYSKTESDTLLAGKDAVGAAAAAAAASLPIGGKAADTSKVNGVAITGTPAAGQMLIASSSSAAAWGTATITGQYLGSAATYAGLPMTDMSGQPSSNGDWAFLTADVVGTGSASAPQYPRGAYVYNGNTFSLAVSLSADVSIVGGDLTGTLPNPTLAATGVTAGTYGSLTIDAKGRITGVNTGSTALNNYTATTDPTTSSDSAAGYAPGSRWINTATATAFVCLANAAGAAVWKRETADVQVFTASGTWTKPTWATLVRMTLIGGGGGGGSGALTASGTACSGGSGGGGAGITTREMVASACGATEAVVVAGAAVGGVAVTTASTAGNAGAAGGSSTFGAHARAGGGYGGGGGGIASTGAPGYSGAGLIGGNAGVSGSNGAAGVTAAAGGGCVGGGSGGGISTAPTAFTGGAGAVSSSSNNFTAGYGGSVAASGGAGGSSAAGEPTPGASGGGGGAGTGASVGGAGGAGGNYGAGGGGGGSAINGSTSGAGGAGSVGIVIVISY